MPPLQGPAQVELEALEFPVLVGLLSRNAKTRRAAATLASMHPWDGLASFRRLRQMELLSLWELEPGALPVVPFDEAMDELLSPAGWLVPEHWRQLREGLPSLAKLLRSISALSWPTEKAAEPGTHLDIDRLQVTAAVLPDPTFIVELLNRSFDEEGRLDPQRVPGLAELYRERQRCFQAVQARLQKLMRDVPEAFQESTIVERNGRYCLPVRLDRKGSVPGLVLDRSSSGATVFIEPFEAVQLNNDYVEADRDYTEAVQTFLRQLLEQLRARRNDFERWLTFQSEVDEILALLRWRSLCEGELPLLGLVSSSHIRQNRLHLQSARHPLLLPNVRAALDMPALDHEVVPLDLLMDENRPGLVISGSNTGGKTVVLKTVGLLAALAHSGCAIPAKAGTELPPLSTLHADIGDHQTLIGSLSTFSSHVVHLKTILHKAKPMGLVLLDELGTGTDPKEGAALGTAVLQALSRRGCWVLASTHLGEISQWTLRHAKFQNASVQFDEERLVPTYRLLVGMPGQSRALTIAAKLGLPPQVLQDAEKRLGRREQDWREFLRQLEAERLRLIEESDALAMREAKVEKDQKILQEREERIRHQQEKFQQESKDKVQRVLDFIDHESKRLVKDLKTKQREQMDADRVGTEAHERVKTIRQIAEAELKSTVPPPKPPGTAEPLKEGSYARHKNLGVEGKLVAMQGRKATLETPTGRRMEVRLSELEPLTRVKQEIAPRAGRVRLHSESQVIDLELNLIGRASDEIEFEVARFLEAALSAGHRFVRIVHGHGTGRLKAAVREALRGHPSIAKVEDAPQAQGGSGATMITLR